MENIYKQRLLKLADFLETLPEERFHFSSWVGNDWKGRSDLSCGTTACALGWATTIPEFQELGLELRKNRFMNGVPCLVGESTEDVEDSWQASVRASYKIFGLNAFEHEFLFSPREDSESFKIYDLEQMDKSTSPKDMAKFIRDFVELKFDMNHSVERLSADSDY